MSRRDDKRRLELRGRLEKSGFKLMFYAVGATCPACGYVFSNGFSSVDGRPHTEASVALCTRCLRPLILEPPGVLRLPTDKERAEIEAEAESPHHKLVRDILGFTREDKH